MRIVDTWCDINVLLCIVFRTRISVEEFHQFMVNEQKVLSVVCICGNTVVRQQCNFR